MSHFEDFTPEPKIGQPESASEQPRSAEELLKDLEQGNTPTDFSDDSVQEPIDPPMDSQQETPNESIPPNNHSERSTEPPPPPPPGWSCGTPLYMQEEMQRRERWNLKRTIKSDTNRAIGLVLLFVIGMQMLASIAVIAYEVIAELTGYGFSEPVYDFFFSYFPVILCESLTLIIGLFWFKTDVKQLFRKPTLQKGEGYKSVLYTGFSLGMIQCGALLFMGIYYLLYAIGIEIYLPEITANTDNMVINILSFAYVVIFGPLLEEIFFRGVLFQKLRKYGDVPTILITSILFALFHCNFVQLLGPLFFGIAIGIVASKTNSLWLCWLIHALNNGIATIYDYLPEKAANIYDISVTAGLVVVGIVCAILLWKDLKDVVKNRRGNCTVLSARAKFGCMVNNACFYIFAAVWLILALLVQFSGNLA